MKLKGERCLVSMISLLPMEAAKRTFRPLWFRTYRYLQLTVETKDEPLVLDDLVGQFTGYPFEEKAQFRARQRY